MKKNLLLIFYIVAAIIIGSLLAALSMRVDFLSWLAFGVDVGFGDPNPAVLDLSLLIISFGIRLSITLAHVICIGAAIYLYNRRGQRR